MKEKSIRTRFTITLSLLVVVGLVFYARLFLFDLDKVPRGGLVDSREVYAISQGSSVQGPKFKEVDISPRKVSLGDNQQLIVKMENPEGVVEVKAITELDSSVKEIVLNKTGDDEWKTEWKVEDTSTKTYRTTFIALAKNGEKNQFTLAWSDPCSGVPLGGTGTLSANCTISGVDGVDNGSLNLNGYTLTIGSGSTFVWNSGFSITTNGTLAVSGELKKTNLWIRDVDADGYAPNSTDQVAQNTQPAGYQRRYTRSGTSDCNDNSVSTWQYLTGYQDSDGDGVTLGGAQSVCSGDSLPSGWRSSSNGSDCNDGNPSIWQYLTGYWDGDGDSYGAGAANNVCSGSSLPGGWVTNSSDCYDLNASAKPGQTDYSTLNRGDGSYDYDCNGSQDQDPSVSCVTNLAGCQGNTPFTDFTWRPGFASAIGCGQTAPWYSRVQEHESQVCDHPTGGPTDLTTCSQSYVVPYFHGTQTTAPSSKQVACR
ncbi:MAG: hypothetical protein HYY99_00615 [Candidatus Colwellbacteria bacterium]|nr:hypothetical protein [Candidatus Colwellbacteria bacterium]